MVETNSNGETCFEHIAGADYCSAFCAEYWSKKLVREMVEQHPNEAEIICENEDGSFLAHIPFKCLKYVKWPIKREMTDEQREALKERGKTNIQKALAKRKELNKLSKLNDLEKSESSKKSEK